MPLDPMFRWELERRVDGGSDWELISLGRLDRPEPQIAGSAAAAFRWLLADRRRGEYRATFFAPDGSETATATGRTKLVIDVVEVSGE